MPIQDELPVTIRHARYLPEMLPFLHAQDLAAGDNSIITLTSPTLSTDIPVLTDKFSATLDADALLKLKADREPTHELESISLAAMGELTPLQFLASKNLSLVFNADAPGVVNYKMYLGIWVVKPSVAQRILWGLPLSSEDEVLSTKRGVRASVEKGVLPFPIPYEIERECIGFKQTYAEVVATAPTGTTTPILTLSPLSGEFLVLESVTADNAALTLADNAQLYITRDDDTNYLKLPVFAMDKSYDFPCFIPALRKLEVNFYHEVGAPLANRYVRVVISRYKVTNLLRARFGLPSTAESEEAIKSGIVP